LLRSHGMTTLTWDRHRGHAASYDVVALGFNYRIDDPRAAFARARLQRLDHENNARRALDKRYRSLLGEMQGLKPTAGADHRLESSHHLFTIVLDAGIHREACRATMADRGVQTSVHYPPVHTFSMYQQEAWDLPLTEAYAQRTISLPMFAHMTRDQQDLVVEALADGMRSGSAM
jgi:dTDP-4-amino-4,6-dideoxygalactose transaminase